MVSDFSPRPLKKLFTTNQCSASFLDAGGLRDIEVEAVTKMLACGTRISGVKEYACDNAQCPHVRYITNACHSRACPSCGKKATDLWIAAQLNRLPDCDWQHLVFTLPDTLWALFEANRWLLNDLCRLAVDNLLYAAGKRGLDIGIFCPIHTYSRRLNWHPHVHVSVTCGGIDEHGKWRKISFRKDAMRTRWMWNVRQRLLDAWSEGIALPVELMHITTDSQWRTLILTAGGQCWYVYMSKKTAGSKNTVRYLGRYLKKPPIAGSRLAHYAGGATLSFRYHDHNTGQQATERLTQHEMVRRLKQHIPEKHFRMVRYFGFLSKRVCGERLPQVYSALGMDKPDPAVKICYAQLSKQFLRRDPFECVLCGGRMVYRRAVAGLNVQGLKIHARDISLMRYIPA
ncbi:IS91 family transposase [Erwinia tracheiphila]|uniref:IS91 family transposase n=1 Tax=Erwinia tracheiphila TaxID=65700 RepID=UPI001F2B488B|nr:IS91 family transposase [Erwinia tracheiphila]UIA83078.1 IS91 family transposase [Erwinia tracheiphila]UIA91656.1 IS91 family transposase [Erwinia tracheiphila]